MLKDKINKVAGKNAIDVSKQRVAKSTPTIIAKDLILQGEIQSRGVIEVEGKINGKIKGNNVVIRESGFIEGEIAADSIVVKGSVNGNLSAKSINICAKAKVLGNIEYGVLSVDDGASIEGSFKKISEK